jgi:hypothetical protein
MGPDRHSLHPSGTDGHRELRANDRGYSFTAVSAGREHLIRVVDGVIEE